MKKPKHSFDALVGILDVLFFHSKDLLASHEWLQLWRTNKTCTDNTQIRSALYIDVWKKMNKIQKTPYQSFDYVRAFHSIHSIGDDWLQNHSITLQQSPFGRFIVAIRREPVVGFDLPKHAALKPHVYTKAFDYVRGFTTYHHVGRVVEAKCNWVNVKTPKNTNELYIGDELYCRRVNISDTEDVPETIRADDAQRPVDYYFQRRCTTCYRCLVVKQPADLFNEFNSMCEQVPQVMESIAHEEREHKETCQEMFASFQRAIYS